MNLYLASFCALLSYHDPELAAHLDAIGFTPEQYAVPWFMTLFAHVLPMDQLYPCLDMLLQVWVVGKIDKRSGRAKELNYT